MNKVMVDKAEAFRIEALEAGWEVEVHRVDDHAMVSAVRGIERVSIAWKGDACLNECFYSVSGKSRKLRNAAATRRALTEVFVPKAVEPTKTATGEMLPPEREVRKLPNWGARNISKSNAFILAAINGKRVTWFNRRTGKQESAPAFKLSIEFTMKRRRVLNFIIPGVGPRSVDLEEIVSVK